MSVNPFTYGRPIDDEKRFIGRQREIEQVFSRLLSACESTSIVGESRTGKTSLLKIIANPATAVYFGITPGEYVFLYQDLQFLDSNTTPTRFWQRVLRSIKRALKEHEDVVEEINFAIKEETIDNYTLDDIFALIDDAGLHIILLLDEFENVTRNEYFDSDFFGGLRALAIHHSLALVTSSRQDLVELTHSQEVRSSPFFNIFATINLRAFSETEATELIDSYLTGTEVKFLLSELNIIFALAGYHPYFIQMVCHHLYKAHQDGLDDAARSKYVMAEVRGEVGPVFHSYWNHASDSQKILLMLLTMRELEEDKNHNTVEELERFYGRASQVITELERRALVIKNTQDNTFHLFSTELREWIADEIVGNVDDMRSWRDWQKTETMVGALPANLQNVLADVVRGLNPNYQEIMSSLLLDPATAVASMSLVEHFVSRYEQYKETRAERDPSRAMADVEAPVGPTPKGLFGRVSLQLEEREQKKTKAIDDDDDDDETIQSKPRVLKTNATASGYRFRRKAGISAIALGSLVISGVVTSLGLDSESEALASDELQWLFNAADHFLKIARHEAKRDETIITPIPENARQASNATNKLLSHLDDDFIGSLQEPIEDLLDRINKRLKVFNSLLNEEAARGTAAKSDTDLQYKINEARTDILAITENLATHMRQAYGIFVTTPEELIAFIQEL